MPETFDCAYEIGVRFRVALAVSEEATGCAGPENLTKRGDRLKGALRAMSARLAAMGYVTSTGRPFSAAQVKRLLEA